MYKNKNRNKGVKISLIVALFAVLLGCLMLFAGNRFLVTENASASATVSESEKSRNVKGVSARSAETLATAWNNAVQISIDTGVQVTFNLAEDWTAQPDATYTTSFGTGVGFSNGRICIPANADIVLDLNGHTLNRNLTSAVENGGVMYVEGALEIKDSGSTGKITGGNNKGDGGGVTVNGGALTLTSGEISGNNGGCGGGVALLNSTFAMNGGIIKSNEADSAYNDGYGGGVWVNFNSTFTMNDGEISGNSTDNEGGGVSSYGEFILNDGKILSNNGYGGGVNAYNGAFTMTGGTISGNISDFGGGVQFCGDTFEMSGGEISGNTAKGTNNNAKGGGVYFCGTTFEMTGGKISNNTAVGTGGAGVYISWKTFHMEGGEISDNHSDGYGGGVCIDGQGGTFIMDGGSIKNNTSIGYYGDSYGGGVYVGRSSTFTLNDGEISGNSSESEGCGVSSYGEFIMNGGTISGNIGGGGTEGGGVNSYEGSFTMNGGEISGNTADGAGGVCAYTNFTMNGGTITGNTSNRWGGGIALWGTNVPYSLKGGSITNNGSVGCGGGIYCCNGKLTIQNVEISGNKAGTSNDKDVYFSSHSAEVWNSAIQYSIYKGEQVGFYLSGGWTAKPDVNFTTSFGEGIGFYKGGLLIPDKANIRLDLQGYTLNRNLTAAVEDGNVIAVNGDIEILDSKGGGKITGGHTSGWSGGVACWNGNVTLTSGEISGNKSDIHGGGISIYGSTLTINGGTVKGNICNGYGGGVYIYNSTLTMNGGTIDGNTAYLNGGGLCIDESSTALMAGGTVSGNFVGSGNGCGGGVAVGHNSAFTMTGGTIDGNTAKPWGGGVYVFESSAFTLENGTISNNSSEGTGGGIYLSSYGSNVFVMNGGTITGNNSAGINGGTSGGGGIYSLSPTNVITLNGGKLSNNTAGYGAGIYINGGGYCTINNCTITGNSGASGSALYVTGNNGGNISTAVLEINDCIIEENESTNGTLSVVNGAIGTINDGTIGNNTSTSCAGGIRVYDATLIINGGYITDNKANQGAGIYADNNATVEMTGGNISGNSTLTGSDEYSANGGGVYLNNSSFTMKGGMINNNTANYYGGGLYVIDGSIFVLADGSINENSINGSDDVSYGAGVCVDGSTFTMNAGYIEGNKTNSNNEVDGLGVYLNNSAFTLNGGYIRNHDRGNSEAYGCGVFLDGVSTFTMNGGEISHNVGYDYGGGVDAHNHESTFIMNGGAITDNEAYNDWAGGVYSAGTFEMNGGTISNNTAAGNGGGVYIHSGEFTMTGGTIAGNTSGNEGGGVYCSGTFKMTGGEISGNHATDDGGGISISGDFYLSGGSIINNTAGGYYGAGIHWTGSLYLSGAITVTGNAYVNGSRKDSNNLYFSAKNLKVVGNLVGSKIGIYNDSDINPEPGYTSELFKYENNGGVDPSIYFFSDKDYSIVLKNGYVCLDHSTPTAPTITLTWQYRVINGTWSNAPESIAYDGKTYEVRALNGSAVINPSSSYKDVNGKVVNSIKVAGAYAFTVTNNPGQYINPSFILKITPKEITYVWDETELYYNGSLQYHKASLIGVLDTEKKGVNVNYDLSNAGINAGDYSVIITGIDGVAASNYKLSDSLERLHKYTIHKAQLAKPTPSGALTYNGEEQAYSIGGYKEEVMTLGGTYAATNAGSYTATIAIKDTKNYEWVDGTVTTIDFNWTINKLYVTVTGGIKANDKYYDGTTDATITATDDLTILGVLEKDKTLLGVKIDSEVEQPAAFESPNAGWHTVTVNGFVLTGDAAKNYELTSNKWVSFAQIKPAELVISGYTVKTKTYDGTMAAEFLKPLLVSGVGFNITAKNGAINLTDATAEWQKLVDSIVLSGTFESANAGTGIAVSGIKFTYPVADEALWSNYKILVADSTATAVAGDITARKVVVEINDVTAVYGQTSNLTYAYATAKADGSAVDGILPQDDLKIELTRAEGDKVGKYAITGTANNAALKDNYEILWVRVKADGVKVDFDSKDPSTQSVYEITKATLKVGVKPLTVVYGSDLELTADDLIFNGFVYGDTVSELGGTLARDKEAKHYSDAGLKNYDFAAYDGTSFKYPDVGNDYAVLASGYTSDNYEIVYEAGTLAVTAKKITVAIDQKTASYGMPDSDLPSLSWQLESGSALLDGHANADLAITLTRENGAKVNGYEEVGRYLVSGTSANANYDINFRNNYYVINPFEVDVKWYETEKDLTTAGTTFTYEYNGEAQTPVAAFMGLADATTGVAATCTSKDTDPFIVVNGSGTNVGTYKAQVLLTDSKNFVFKAGAMKEVEFKISEKEVEVKWFVKEGDKDSIILANNADGSLAVYEYQLNRVYKPFAAFAINEDKTGVICAVDDGKVTLFVEGGQTTVSGTTPHTATAYIVGSSNYKIKAGTESCKFVISKTVPDDLKWFGEDGKEYTSGNLSFEFDGEAHSPHATTTLGTFTYEFKNADGNTVFAAINAGEYTIVAIPLNSNIQLTKEQKEFKFKITPKEVEVVWSALSFEYNGSVQTPEASFVDVNGNTVKLGVTLGGTTAEYGKNVDKYKAQTRLGTGVKNYVLKGAEEGVVECEFEITAKAITVKWDFANNEFTYNGTAYNDGTVTPELNNPVAGEEPALTYTILRDGKEVTEIKDAGAYTLRVALADKNGALNNNYTVVDDEFSITVKKAALKVTAKDQEVITGEMADKFSAKFEGLVNGETPLTINAATEVIKNDDGTDSEFYYVNWLTSLYAPSAAYTKDGYDIVLANSADYEEALKNYEVEFVAGHITLKVKYGNIRVTADLAYDGKTHEVQAWYFNGNETDDPTDESLWIPLDVVICKDKTYSSPLLDDNNNPVKAVKNVGKYYIRLDGLPSNISAVTNRIFEITVRNVVVHIKDINTVYGSLTADNLKTILEDSWEWDSEPLRQPASGEDLGITLNLYKQLIKITENDFDEAGYLNVWKDGDYTIRGEWNEDDFKDKYSVTFVGSQTDDGVNGWGVCYMDKAEIAFTGELDENGFNQLIEDLSVNVAIDKKNSKGEYINFKLEGNQNAAVTVSYSAKYSLDYGDEALIPLPADEISWATNRPSFELTAADIANGLEHADRHYAVNFKIEVANHETYFGQWRVEVLGSTVCIKIIFADKELNAIYGGTLEDGETVPEGKELASYLYENGFIDKNLSTVTAADVEKLSAKVVTESAVSELGVGKYGIVFEGVENVVQGKYVLTYKKQLSDEDKDATNLGKFVVNPRTLEVEWGETEFTYNGEKQISAPVIKGWSCKDDYTVDGVYTFVNDTTGESIKIKVTLTGDFIKVGGHGIEFEIVDNDNYTFRSGEAVKTTKGVLSIVGETGVETVGVGLPDWALGVIIAAGVLAVAAIIALAVMLKKRKATVDEDGFYEDADMENS